MLLDAADLDLPVLVSLVGTALDERALRELRAAGHPRVRRSHGFLVQLLVDETPTVSEVGERLGVSQQAASKSVAELESLGYVERRPDAADNRVRRVALTDAGRVLLERGRAQRHRVDAAVAADMSPEDLAAARRVLVALLEQAGGLDSVLARRVPLPTD